MDLPTTEIIEPFFMGLKKGSTEEPTIEKLASIFQNKIIPLLSEANECYIKSTYQINNEAFKNIDNYRNY